MAETVQERQQNELEALKAIFGPQLVRSNECRGGKNGKWAPLDCVLSLGPQQGSVGHQEAHAFIDVHITCDNLYPEKVPKIALEKSKGLSLELLSNLQNELENLAKEKKGEVMIYEIAHYTMNFLHRYNKPGIRSFYDEMVNRQQAQIQRELERRQAFEDRKRNEILLEIENKQKAMRKETRRRRSSASSPYVSEEQNHLSATDEERTKEQWSPMKSSFPVIDPKKADGVNNGTDDEEDDNLGVRPRDSEEFSPWNLMRGASRIESEFEVLHWLGKGAFGDVIKVRNKLDGCLYAIKRIGLSSVVKSSQLYRKITREVKLLSRLNHENVVRYYNSWIETSDIDPPLSDDTPSSSDVIVKSEQSKMVEMLPKNEITLDWSVACPKATPTKDHPSASETSDDDEGDSDDCWITFMSGGLGESSSGSSSGEESESESVSVPEVNGEREDKTAANVGGKEMAQSEAGSSHTHPLQHQQNQQQQFMYIQMEFCEKSTLRNAIDEGLSTDVGRVWRLFREIVEGLSHIHQQGIIHRDLKPVNIFIDCDDHVKIGDFGLATTNILHTSIKEAGVGGGLVVGGGPLVAAGCGGGDATATSHTGQVGTALYVAPELNTIGVKASYNQKVDIYSLGVIFFEMCYRPLPTAMERMKVLTDLRQPDCLLPSDFQETDNVQQAHIIRWLLCWDASRRPSSQEVLQSKEIPPPQLEEAHLQEMVSHTLSNPQSKAYKHLVAACFTQGVSAGQDVTFDMPSTSSVKALSAQHLLLVRETASRVEGVFRLHGAVSLPTPLLTPCGYSVASDSGGHPLPDSAVRLMTRWGGVVAAPNDLRLPFIRYLARNPAIVQLRRYAIDRVYRERRVLGFHPKELVDCAFDIVTPTPGCSGMVDAELVSVAWEALKAVGVLATAGGKDISLRLNHASIVKGLLLHCGLEPSTHHLVCSILSGLKLQKGAAGCTRSEVEAALMGAGLSSSQVALLFNFIGVETTYERAVNMLKPVMRKKTVASSLLREGLHHIQLVTQYARRLGVKCLGIVSPGLVSEIHWCSGLMFQLVWSQRSKHGRVDRVVVAAGGRYDATLQHFRQMLVGSKEGQQYAAGVSLSLDRLVSALEAGSTSRPVVEVVVCYLGQTSRQAEALSVLCDLWAAGISASLIDTPLNLEEIQTGCVEGSVPQIVVLLKDTDPGAVRLRYPQKSAGSGSRQTTYQERRLLQTELVDHLQRAIRSRSWSLSTNQPSSFTALHSTGQEHGYNHLFAPSSGISQQLKMSSDSSKTPSESSAQPLVNITFVTLTEKLTAAARRRYENQIQNSIGVSLQRVSPRAKVEVFAVGLEAEVIRLAASHIDITILSNSDLNLTPVIKSFPRHKKYLLKIGDEIQEVVSAARDTASSSTSHHPTTSLPVLVLYSTADNYFKFLL